MVAVAGRADAGECGADADGCHVEGAAMCGRCAVHVLYALVAVVGAAHVEVYLEVGEGFEGHLDLHVFGLGDGGRGGYAVAADEPSARLGFVEIGVVDETEGEIDSGGEHAAHASLSEHVAHFGEEAGDAEVVGVAIADADVAQHHEEAGCGLSDAVPLLLGGFGEGYDVESEGCGIDGRADDLDAVLIDLLELDVVGESAAVASCDADALGLLSVGYDEVGIGIECDFLHEAFVLGFLCPNVARCPQRSTG